MIMLRISGVLSILLTRRTKDNTVNKSRATDSVWLKKAIRFSTIYKNDGNKTKSIVITNRLLPVSSPLFTTKSTRRFDAIINVEQWQNRISYSFNEPHVLWYLVLNPRNILQTTATSSRRKAVLSVTIFLVFFKYWFLIEDKNGKLINNFPKKSW